MTEFHLDNLSRYLGAVGEYVDVIGFGDDLGMQTGPQISPAMYREFFKERDVVIEERRLLVKFDANPEVLVGYHKPTYPSREAYIFDVIDALLTGGRTSRLFRRMVDQERLALSVRTGSSLPADRYDNLFFFHGVPRAPHTTKDLEDALYQEIERLKTEPVTDWELQKIKNQVRAGFIYALRSNEGLASQLAYYEAFFGGWKRMLEYSDIIESITPDEIIQVAQKYLHQDNRTVATLVQKK